MPETTNHCEDCAPEFDCWADGVRCRKRPAPPVSALDYSPEAMVRRAVMNARPHRTTEAPRWVAVMDVFGFGSTTSVELCRRFRMDPHEKVPGVKCDCADD